jgi:ABC-type Fe3+-hydroxamate transport system substrate-binding protein
VGVTRFCVRPAEKVKTIKKIGRTKTIKLNDIIALQPDLVIANKEENSKNDIEKLSTHCPVWVTDIRTLEDALEMIVELGKKTNCSHQADQLAMKILTEFRKLETTTLIQKKSVLYLIWESPIMVAGRDTFINDLLEKNGWENATIHTSSRYPEMTIQEMRNIQPDYIFLSSEPFPFKETHQKKYAELYPKSVVRIVDGEMFSWYGSRLVHAPKYFQKLSQSLICPTYFN